MLVAIGIEVAVGGTEQAARDNTERKAMIKTKALIEDSSLATQPFSTDSRCDERSLPHLVPIRNQMSNNLS